MIAHGLSINVTLYLLLLQELVHHLKELKQCVKDIEQDVQMLWEQHQPQVAH